LIRKIIEVSGAQLDQDCDGQPLIDALMAPTRIYVKPVLTLLEQVDVHALSHITGGGLLENLPRVMPANTQARVDTQSWTRPAVFDWLQTHGNVDFHEMHRTFNCGIGMVIVVPQNQAQQATELLRDCGETVTTIGHIEHSDEANPGVILN
jgi:phosphoribosylformylglycinamidine cyclo-ligase